MATPLVKKIVELTYKAKEGHLGSSLSVLDIISVIYEKDRTFILSKGHASLALYVVLAERGYITHDTLESFCQYSSPLGGHPKRGGPILASTGSLGHGFPMAVGMAFARKILKDPRRVFCLIGDGECNEGTVWEAAALAYHHKLDNLTLIVDQNHSSDRALRMKSLWAKFMAFGWKSVEVDGHNKKSIRAAFALMPTMPLAIIANTVKGKGIDFMENNPEWHHKVPNQEEFEKAIR